MTATAVNATASDKPYARLMTITPDLAQQWLDGSNAHNRRLSMTHCERLARDIRSGNWRTTHEGIAFSPHGRLLDGQHRLKAITLAGKSVEMFVWFNVPADALMVINHGRNRTIVDALTLSGVAADIDSRDIAILRAMLAGLDNRMVLTAAESAPEYQKHKDAIEFAKVFLPHRINGVATSDTRAVIARAFYSVHLDRLAHFCEVLSMGVSKGTTDQPIVMLFTYLLRHRGNSDQARRDRYARTERALHAFIYDEQISRLFAATYELFPLPSEEQATC